MTRLKYLDPSDGQYKLLPVGGGSGGGMDEATADARYVNVTGDTMSGNLTLTNPGSSPILYINGASATQRAIRSQTNGVTRWALRLADQATETGNNTGSDFWLMAYDDAGSNAKTVLWASRSEGLLRVVGDPNSPLGIATKQYTDGKVAKTGDTMTGDLAISKASPIVQLDATPGTSNDIRYSIGGVLRWVLRSGGTESGGDTGSDLEVISRTDAGASKLSVLKFLRNTGHAIFGASVAVTDRITSFRGMDMGSTAAASATDLSKHLALYGTNYGLNVTSGTLNHVSGGAHAFNSSLGEQGRFNDEGLKMSQGKSVSIGYSKEVFIGNLVWGTTAQAVGYVAWNPGGAVVGSIEITISGDYNSSPAMGKQTRRTTLYIPYSIQAPTFYTDDLIDNWGVGSYNYWLGPAISWQTNPKLALWPIYKLGGVNTDVRVTARGLNGEPIENGKMYVVAPDVYNHNILMPHPYWISLGLSSGWQNLDGRTARVRRTIDNTIILSGVVTGGANNTIITTLPTSHLPIRGSVDVPVGVANGQAVLNIAPDGNVKVLLPTAGANPTTYTYLDCSFAI